MLIHLPPPVTAPPETATVRRVRTASRWAAGLFTGLLALFGLAATAVIAAMLFYSGPNLSIGPAGAYIGHAPPDTVPFGSLPLGQRASYAVVGVIRSAPAAAILWNLRALFRLYAGGAVFGPRNATHIGRIGLWLVAHALAPAAGHLLLTATGYEIDRKWLHLASFQSLVLGAVVWIIARVMEVGREIEEDRETYI